jgi:hypothetical protein
MNRALSGMRGVGVGLGVLAAKKAGPLTKKADLSEVGSPSWSRTISST